MIFLMAHQALGKVQEKRKNPFLRRSRQGRGEGHGGSPVWDHPRTASVDRRRQVTSWSTNFKLPATGLGRMLPIVEGRFARAVPLTLICTGSPDPSGLLFHSSILR